VPLRRAERPALAAHRAARAMERVFVRGAAVGRSLCGVGVESRCVCLLLCLVASSQVGFFETFGIDADALAAHLQQRLAASAAVEPVRRRFIWAFPA
jgi:hypothetical protein